MGKAFFPLGRPIRIDLHCHSRASTEADEAVLLALRCSESYSEPEEVYAQAKSRGMDFVTITDHDSIAGINELRGRADVIVGEELTCYFPEDRCKIHLLLWGITAIEHELLQGAADDIYEVAKIVASLQLAHAVAHPLYRQNDRLDRWHVERLLLLFKGFECLNGAHSSLHRESFERLLDGLDEAKVRNFERIHSIKAIYAQPWVKARTGGSDDHGLFNVGRTWTEFPAEAKSVQEILNCICEGRCRPGGEAGSSLKLAHNFYGVGLRYFSKELLTSKHGPAAVLSAKIVGEKVRGSRATMARMAVRHASGRIAEKTRKLLGLRSRHRGTRLLSKLMTDSGIARLAEHADVASAIRGGRAPLAEHRPMFEFISSLMRDVTRGIAAAAVEASGDGEIGELFDAAAAVLAQQAMMLPYYFALFLQNQERHLLGRITGDDRAADNSKLRIGIFSDSFHGDESASRLARDAAGFAHTAKLDWTVLTCGTGASSNNNHVNFEPLLARIFGAIGSEVAIPPVLEILELADRKQFDVIVVNTAGPMGLCGLLAARMLRVPVVAASHADVAATVLSWTNGDYRLGTAAQSYAKWFYAAAKRVLVRGRSGSHAVERLGIATRDINVMPPSAPYPKPEMASGRQEVWQKAKVKEPNRIICSVSAATAADADLTVSSFERVCMTRKDAALVFTASTPWVDAIAKRLKGLPVYRIEAKGDRLMELYASGELLIYPNSNDVCGQIVVDALAMGLPVLTGDVGAGSEVVDDAVTGRVLPMKQPTVWADAILELLTDEAQRQRMGRNGPQRLSILSPGRDVEVMWHECVRAVSTDSIEPHPNVNKSEIELAKSEEEVQV